MTAPERARGDFDWTVTSVAECLDVARHASTATVATTDYKLSGQFPIVDQSIRPIAGYTDDEDLVVKTGLPVVVFGDHTRALKYVDFPFARGADGTQLLRTNASVDTKFFYYACRQINLPSRGYNRHFTLLREQEIRVPSTIAEQNYVVRALDLVEQARSTEEQLALAAEELKAALMDAAFTRGLRRAGDEGGGTGLPSANWEAVPLAEVGVVVTGTTPRTKERIYYDDGRIPFISPGDVEHGRAIDTTQRQITDAGLAVSRRIPRAATCVVCIGSTIGKVGLTTAEVSTTNQQINAVVPGDAFDPNYVFYALAYNSEAFRRAATPGPVPLLSKGAFERLTINMTKDLEEQREVAGVLQAIDNRISLHRQRSGLYGELFNTLLHRLMNGEVRIGDLDMSALPETEVLLKESV